MSFSSDQEARLEPADEIFTIRPAPADEAQPPRLWHNLVTSSGAKRLIIITALLGLWQSYSSWLNYELLLPSPLATLRALAEGFLHGTLPSRLATSLGMLLSGYAIGIALAGAMTALAMSSRWGRELLATLTAMFNPLPAIALLPLAMLWFGLGTPSMLFVLAHAVLWPVALNTLAGFEGVSPTLRMVGRNYGLSGPRYVLLILMPAAFPSLLTGLKIGWAFAWRTLIAAELVFGVSAGSGGLGWYIYENKNQLEIPAVFAGLSTVIVIGLAVEYLIFKTIEQRTVRRWGMQS